MCSCLGASWVTQVFHLPWTKKDDSKRVRLWYCKVPQTFTHWLWLLAHLACQLRNVSNVIISTPCGKQGTPVARIQRPGSYLP